MRATVTDKIRSVRHTLESEYGVTTTQMHSSRRSSKSYLSGHYTLWSCCWRLGTREHSFFDWISNSVYSCQQVQQDATVVVTAKRFTAPLAICHLCERPAHICDVANLLTNSRSRLESSRWFYRKLEITLSRRPRIQIMNFFTLNFPRSSLQNYRLCSKV